MTNRFMISAAALALIAGTGFAHAQGMSKESGGAGGAAMQHSAPADTSAAPSQSGSSTGASRSEANEPSKGGLKSSQTEQKQPGAMKNERAEDNNVKGGSTSQRAEDRGKGASENQRAEDATKSGNVKAEGREGRDNNMKAEGREGRDNNMKAEGREGRDNNMRAEDRQDKTGTNSAETKSTTERSQTTTGQAGAGAKLTSDQRTKITTVIHNQHVESVNNVNFSVSVGTRVPREGVHFYPLPEEVVSIYPQWRGYEFILVRERIVIIDPQSYEIVEIIES
ncbi:MAG: DUF1236 domain-containing protein [Bradyrhizobium sp.]|nr:DUF1236 domain-containing protein [Bradyrhizobium sp.]